MLWYELVWIRGVSVENSTTVFTTTVSDNCGADTKTGNPTVEESSCNSFSCDVCERNCFWPPRETINTGEQVRVEEVQQGLCEQHRNENLAWRE